MVYVIRACADQAEAINKAIDSNRLPLYKLTDVLPGHRLDITTIKYRDGLAVGTQKAMRFLLNKDFPAYETIEEVVWRNNPTVFGLRVCSV